MKIFINTEINHAIRIAFQAPYNLVEYVFEDITVSYSGRRVEHNNYEHLGDFCVSSMVGSEVKLCESNLSRILFESFLDDISYCQVYELQQNGIMTGKGSKMSNFYPC